MDAVIGLCLAIATFLPPGPKFRRGEITLLPYCNRYAVVLDVSWDGCEYEYTVVPAELVFPHGVPAQ